MELKEGMYVRTLTLSGFGRIAKLIKIDDICITDNGAIDKNQIVKASNNIIDLIEVGDYVNGLKITLINEPSMANCNKRIIYAEDEEGYLIKSFNEKDIKSIVTKEQFSSMEYKVNE